MGSCLVLIAFMDLFPKFVTYILTRTLGFGPQHSFLQLIFIISCTFSSHVSCLHSAPSPESSILPYSCYCADPLHRVYNVGFDGRTLVNM